MGVGEAGSPMTWSHPSLSEPGKSGWNSDTEMCDDRDQNPKYQGTKTKRLHCNHLDALK